MNALQRVCNIIQTELGIDSDQVVLWNQKWNMPSDLRLYIVLRVIRAKPFSNVKTYESSGDTLIQNQTVNIHATLSLDIQSRSDLARERKEEVLMALKSDYAERMQAAESFRIFPLSQEFLDISQIDGAAIPYRFNISANLQYMVSKAATVEFYENFDQPEVTTEQ